jgi:hypothetical protein
MPDREATLALLRLSRRKPSARPVVVIGPRSRRPETTAAPVSAHERSMRAADTLGRELARLAVEDRCGL